VHRVFIAKFETMTLSTIRVFIRHKQFINSDVRWSFKDLEKFNRILYISPLVFFVFDDDDNDVQ